MAAVREDDDAAGSDDTVAEFKRGETPVIIEHALSRTEGDREEKQSVPVNEVVLDEPADHAFPEPNMTRSPSVLSLTSVIAEASSPVSWWEFRHPRWSNLEETTYFGMRFMAATAGSETSAAESAVAVLPG
nr:hypothetical protein [Corynebacterium sp. CNJ-954]